MTTNNDYTKRELELMFNRFDEKLEDIKRLVELNNTQHESHRIKMDEDLKTVRDEVQKIKDWQNRAMAIWGVLVFVVGLLAQNLIKLFQ